ncbi:hypothetical protein [Adhaeretor mobilis]|uniref:Uncharacterized protein n=1 Tax=Adhaeretor mobilis TaxID=1930276 RepID=A0A517MQA6_9BACT|nr:hypothetical protein [Adhaeretor mobilis]QDS97052.1 hypothetical protein HG15A2_03110 [Adhaeretor mobilis]
MKVIHFSLLICSLAIVTSTGCGTAANSATNTTTTAADIDASQYQLAEEPDDAVGVIAARESAVDGAPLVLMGRVGGSANPWIDGRAAFTLLDASMSVVAEGEDSGDDEMCLGDCCAVDRQNCTTLVKVVDAQGKLVPVDSRELLGLKEADMVVVKGTAQKDKTGNFVMLAKGVFIRK